MLAIRFAVNVALSVDQFGNTISGGHPDETLSSRLGRTIHRPRYFWVKWFRCFVDRLFFFDKKVIMKDGKPYTMKHCEKSIMPLEQQNFREVADYEIWCWNK